MRGIALFQAPACDALLDNTSDLAARGARARAARGSVSDALAYYAEAQEGLIDRKYRLDEGFSCMEGGQVQGLGHKSGRVRHARLIASPTRPDPLRPRLTPTPFSQAVVVMVTSVLSERPYAMKMFADREVFLRERAVYAHYSQVRRQQPGLR